MKIAYLLIASLLFAGCAGKRITSNHARDVIVGKPQDVLEKEDVEIVKVSQASGSEAVVETRLKTAFRLEKVQGQWIVKDVRLGHDQWETVANLLQTLETVRIEETRKMLDRIADAVRKYREATGSMPSFKDYIALSDLLSPKYLTPLVRLDAWRRPLAAERMDANTIRLVSAGPDGKFGTEDDLRLIVP